MIFINKIGRKTVIISIFLILAMIFIGSVFALSANLGNARMVLHVKTGDLIEKTVLVKNVNNETINIEADASGDLAKDITIKNPKFTLAEGEEKNIEFTIKVRNEGTSESKINVKFISQVTKQGVGLSSTIIVIADKGNGTVNFDDSPDTSDTSGTDSSGSAGLTDLTSKLDIKFLAVAGTIILLVAFIILYIISTKKRKVAEIKEVREEKGSIKSKKEIEKK